MIQIDKTLQLQPASLRSLEAYCRENEDSYCFFDIETTGLSARVSSLYLIGALWYDREKEHFAIRQWFADDYISERDLILSFTDFLAGFTTLVHYNGSGFDLPYLEKKCSELDLPTPFATVKNLDIYREIRKQKPLFHVPNLKLATVEKLVGFMRTDTLTGKDCIQVYSQFMQKKYFRDAAMELEKQKLLLHNAEDLIGTYLSAQLLSYRCDAALTDVARQAETVTAYFRSGTPYPFPVSWEQDGFSLDYSDHTVQLTIPLYHGTLLYFFDNYKDYFYLPAEDTAIHKSVGIYVDREFREPAKASNCRVKKEGVFLSLPAGYQPDMPARVFRESYRSKARYLLWEEDKKQDPSLYRGILKSLIPS